MRLSVSKSSHRHDCDDLSPLEERDDCIIAVVGSGMKGTPGVAARVFGAVAGKKVNVRMVAQGSSDTTYRS